MPFTPAHVVAVLPLATGRPGRRLVPAALVIGSVIPDLPYFVTFLHHSDWTHAASGPVTIDLVLGLAVFAGWYFVLRRPLVDLAPRWLAGRLPRARSLNGVGWLWAVLSVVLGALTHVVWDTFTHRHRWGTDHVAVLNELLGPLPAYKWLQFTSGATGLIILVVWTLVWLRGRPARPVTRATTAAQRIAAWYLVVAAFVGAVAVLWLPALVSGAAFDESVLFTLATGSIAATSLAVVGLCLGWHLVGFSRRSTGLDR
jgi:hypothetical protein